MAKTIQLQFLTEMGKTASLTVDYPKEPVDPAALKQSMEAIIASDVFFSSSGKFTAVKGAAFIDRHVTEIPLS